MLYLPQYYFNFIYLHITFMIFASRAHLQYNFFLIGVKVKVTQLCLTLCDPMDDTVHEILQARILEWVAFPFIGVNTKFALSNNTITVLHNPPLLACFQNIPSLQKEILDQVYSPTPVLGNHSSTLRLYGFAGSGHFIQVGSYNMRPSVSGFSPFASCAQGSPVCSFLWLNNIPLYCCCSVTQPCPTLCEPTDYSMPGFPVLHCLPEFAQDHVH